jgi:hypothetical protein
MRLLIAAALLIAIQDSAAAGSFRCNVARGTMTTYQKDGRWEDRVERGELARSIRQLHVILSEGGNSATLETIQPGDKAGFKAIAEWREIGGVIMVVQYHELGGANLLSIFRDQQGKRPATWSRHAGLGYGGVATQFSGHCEAE